ncbi:hypothetical protein BSZ39_12295 [Bowdeniella nasicola]|uniref:Uncharacterized protein n=1 Tax=Bowdeniella nasicola TaxID=208480 RepID=A0A1Q5PZ64_9ACTO|nr:hypothetical protein BSZ39_12295 [Bowdeniella nasicola]
MILRLNLLQNFRTQSHDDRSTSVYNTNLQTISATELHHSTGHYFQKALRKLQVIDQIRRLFL